MLEGLKLTWSSGFRHVEVESANALLVNIMKNGLDENNNVTEVKLIYTWASKNWQVKFSLISRDSNRVAD